MKSIGISVRTKSSASTINVKEGTVQLHLNLWKFLPSKKKSNISQKSIGKTVPFNLDIGVMGKFSISEIRLYFPFTLKDIDPWIDLAPILTQNKTILCSLFNDDYEVKNKCGNFVHVALSNSRLKPETKQEGNPLESKWYTSLRKILTDCICGPKDQSKDTTNTEDETPKEFYIYHIQKSDVKVTNYADKGSKGFVLNITIPEFPDCSPEQYFYIRLRIPIENAKDIAYNTNLSNDWLQSAFTRLDMYNLQINELREISDIPVLDLLEKDYNSAVFSKIHMLYVVSPEVEIKTGSSVKSDSRLIEAESWQPYIPPQYMADVYLAHHWKFPTKRSTILHKMQLFFTAEYPELHFNPRVIPYAAGVILLGCLGSLIASGLCAISITILKTIAFVAATSPLISLFWYIIHHVLPMFY